MRKHACTDEYSCCGYRSGYDWDGFLVYPARATGMVQLEEERHGGATGDDDVPMGGMFVAVH